MTRKKNLGLFQLPWRKSKPKFGRTLYLHIGTHRTGTTSIQDFLRRNSVSLIKRGYLLANGQGRHNRLVNQLYSGKCELADVAYALEAEAVAAESPIQAIIMSDEDISSRDDLTLIQQFREYFDVKIIYAMRRQDIWLESWFFQNIKWQWNSKLSHCNFEDFLAQRGDFHWISYDSFVSKLEELFGPENIILRVFEKEQMPEGPVIDYCHALGITDMAGFSEPPHINSSMSAEMVEFVRHLPLGDFPPPQRERIRRALEAVDRLQLGHASKQSERLMPLAQRKDILAEYEAGNTALAQRRFGRDKLFLAPLPAADAPLARLEIPSDSETLLRKFVAPMLAQLVEDDSINPPE